MGGSVGGSLGGSNSVGGPTFVGGSRAFGLFSSDFFGPIGGFLDNIFGSSFSL